MVKSNFQIKKEECFIISLLQRIIVLLVYSVWLSVCKLKSDIPNLYVLHYAI